MGAGSKLMPLTQQPSFEAVKTLDVTPSTRAGNTKTLSYLVRLVLYTEPGTDAGAGSKRPGGWDEVSRRQSLRHPLTGPRLGAGDDALPKGMVSPPARTQISRYLLSQQVKAIYCRDWCGCATVNRFNFLA